MRFFPLFILLFVGAAEARKGHWHGHEHEHGKKLSTIIKKILCHDGSGWRKSSDFTIKEIDSGDPNTLSLLLDSKNDLFGRELYSPYEVRYTISAGGEVITEGRTTHFEKAGKHKRLEIDLSELDAGEYSLSLKIYSRMQGLLGWLLPVKRVSYAEVSFEREAQNEPDLGVAQIILNLSSSSDVVRGYLLDASDSSAGNYGEFEQLSCSLEHPEDNLTADLLGGPVEVVLSWAGQWIIECFGLTTTGLEAYYSTSLNVENIKPIASIDEVSLVEGTQRDYLIKVSANDIDGFVQEGTISITHPDGAILSYSSLDTLQVSLSKAGNYVIKFIVIDNEGATGLAEVEVQVEEAPVADGEVAIALSGEELAPNKFKGGLRFDVEKPSSTSSKFDYVSWDLGDGNVVQNMISFSHSYAEVGSYR